MNTKFKAEPSSSIRVNNKVLRRVKVFVAEKDTTMLEYVSIILEREMNKQDKIKQKKSGIPF